MRTFIAALIIAACLALSGYADDTPPSTVDGLSITASQTVVAKEGFVVLEAKCTGTVSWLVVSASPVKYLISDPDKHIVVAVPETGVVSVFCIGLVDGKQTPFARSDITVQEGPAPPPPAAQPTVSPVPAGTRIYITIVDDKDPLKRSKDIPALLKSVKVQQLLIGHVTRVLNAGEPEYLGNEGLVREVNKIGQYPAVVAIVKDADGKGRIIAAQVLPKSEADFLAFLRSLISQ